MEISGIYQRKVSTKLKIFGLVVIFSSNICLAAENTDPAAIDTVASQLSEEVGGTVSSNESEVSASETIETASPAIDSETAEEDIIKATAELPNAGEDQTLSEQSATATSQETPKALQQIITGAEVEKVKEVPEEARGFLGVLSSINPFNKKDDNTNKATNEQYVLNSTNHKIEDLAYGEVLFDYYNDRDLDAIVRLRVAQDENQLNANIKHGELLLAQLYILQGLPNHADKVLEGIDNELLDEETRTLILHQLARINMYQGNLGEARKILENDGNDLDNELVLGRDILLNKIYLDQKDKNSIQKVLNKIDPNATRNFYSKYNLAMSGLFIEDEELFLPLLKELSEMEHWDLESRSLKDKALLTLAQYHIKNDEFDSAKDYLSRVGYKGPHSIAALYHLAWIELEREQYQNSFSLWVNLTKRNPLNKYVGRSFLIRPYALEKLGSEHLALEGYFHAAELYQKLISDIQMAIEIIGSESWINQLKPHTLSSISMYETIADKPEWVRADGFEANFLVTLFATDKFAITHQNFWEIELLRRNMEINKNKLEVFEAEYNNYDAEFQAITPEVLESLQNSKNEQIIQRIEIIEGILSEIIHENNFLSAPNELQAKTLTQIAYLHNELGANSQGNSAEIQNRYLEKLQAIQAWDMSQDSAERQWQLREQYSQLIGLLSETKKYYQNIRTGLMNSKYAGIGERISDLSTILPLRASQLELLSLKNQQLLQAMALEILEDRKEEYKSLSVKAKLAAARLQDIVVTGGQK